MTLTVAPLMDDVITDVGNFIVSIVPAGTPVLRGPIDRAAYPNVDFVLVTPVFRDPLRTTIVTHDPDAGVARWEQGTKVELQVDLYGDTLGADWCAMFSTMWKTEYACDALGTIAPGVPCSPLYTDGGRMMPLVTGEEQYSERWMVRTFLQYNPTVSTPQDYADTVDITVISVDVAFPP
jgi:hypothetical protein